MTTPLEAPHGLGYANWVQTVVSSFAGRSNCLSIPVLFVRFCGSYEAAAFLSQSLYWSDRTNNSDGWFYKSYAEWEEELCLSEFQIRRLSRWFGQLKLIETHLKKQHGAPTLHYRVDSQVFAELFLEFLKNPGCKGFLKQFDAVEPSTSNLKKLKNATSSGSRIDPLVPQEWIPEPLRNDLYTQIIQTDPTTDPTHKYDSDESRSRAPTKSSEPNFDKPKQPVNPPREASQVPCRVSPPASSAPREESSEISHWAKNSEKSKKAKKAEPAIEADAFEQWWSSYRRFAVSIDASAGSRAEAVKEWNLLLMSEAGCLDALVEGADWYQRCKVGQYQKRGEAIGVPHGCRFLKHRLWEEAVMHKQWFDGQSGAAAAKLIKPAVVDLSEALALIGAHLKRLEWCPMQRIEHLQEHYGCQSIHHLSNAQIFDFMHFLEQAEVEPKA